jgi:hypothetical protein
LASCPRVIRPVANGSLFMEPTVSADAAVVKSDSAKSPVSLPLRSAYTELDNAGRATKRSRPMSNPTNPLTFSRNPKLDFPLLFGWERWIAAARAAGIDAVAAWLAARAQDADLAATAREFLEPVLSDQSDAEERFDALVSLAELAEELDDDRLADAFWEGALDEGLDASDPDAIFEATSRLAALAERNGDPLAAAEYWIAFLNWRREPEHSSDPEQVEDAFDEIVRLADVDGARREAAIWSHRQVEFTRLAEDDDDERAVAGDWTGGASAWSGWA